MKKSNKKIISLLLAVMMAFAITACSSGGQGASQGADQAKPSGEGQTTQAVQEAAPAADESAEKAETAAPAAEESSSEAQTAVSQAASTSTAEKAAEQAESINYLALVNKQNPLPDGWEDALETVHMTNSIGDDVEVEKKAYDAYLKLKEDLEKEGIFVDLDSARRSVAEQQRIMDDFTQKYGADYALKTVATPGYSAHCCLTPLKISKF